MLLLGRHTSIAGGLDKAFDRAAEMRCTAMQIFDTNPRGWQLSPIDSSEVGAFRSKMESTGIVPVVHMPYLPNISSSKSYIFSKSVKSLIENVERCSDLGIGYLVTHMGSHMGHGKKAAIEHIVWAVEKALDLGADTRILLENEAGHKNSVGDAVKDMTDVCDAIGDKRLGFCLDTCHLFAAGYDITSHDALDGMFGELDIRMVHSIHLNDAKFGLGSRRDRHANIGYGYIGMEGFRSFLAYKGIQSKILLLETPSSVEISEGKEIEKVRALMP